MNIVLVEANNEISLVKHCSSFDNKNKIVEYYVKRLKYFNRIFQYNDFRIYLSPTRENAIVQIQR